MRKSTTRSTPRRPRTPRLTFESIVGLRVLAGMTYVNEAGIELERVQLHGLVVRADPEGIILAAAPDDSEFWLPPDLSAFRKAAPGTYALKSSHDVVVDPDLLCTWRVTRPAAVGPAH